MLRVSCPSLSVSVGQASPGPWSRPAGSEEEPVWSWTSLHAAVECRQFHYHRHRRHQGHLLSPPTLPPCPAVKRTSVRYVVVVEGQTWLSIANMPLLVITHTDIFYHSQLEGEKAYDASESFLSKVTFRCSIHTCASFYFESQLSQTERGSSILECFHSQTVTCYWPVRNMRCHGPEFHGHNTAHNNWK